MYPMMLPGLLTSCSHLLQQFGGWNKRFKHASKSCGCDMLFTVYFPPQTSKGKVPVRDAMGTCIALPVPSGPDAQAMSRIPLVACALQVVYYLSGLSCTDENFIQKSGGQRKAAELGVAVVCPDTSPRQVAGVMSGNNAMHSTDLPTGDLQGPQH